MIVVAIDISYSTDDNRYASRYRETIHEVLIHLNPPIRVIYWNNCVTYDQIVHEITKDVCYFKSSGYTTPHCFIEILPTDDSIELYIFTDGCIYETDVNDCRSLLKRKNLQFKIVHLYYIGIESEMNLKFTDLFADYPKNIQINTSFIGRVEPGLINFDDITYEYIMRDNSFKAKILTQINSPEVDKSKLKNQLNLLTYRILKEHFEDKLKIQSFYIQRDVKGCIDYVKKHSYYVEKSHFQSKMDDILKLFDKNIDTYSLEHFKPVTNYTLVCDEEKEEKQVESEQKEENEPPLDTKLLTCDILLQHCKLPCIPLKICTDDVWLDKKILRNPFSLLESDTLIERIVKKIEPYVMDYKNVYTRLENPNVSPFSRDSLQGVYLLHNDSIDVRDMIEHNNYVLSTFFQNRLPGKPILWHMIFLYIMALRRFPEMKDIFFEEIRFLGQHDKYFITLIPYLNPPIVEDLNCCFWYVAHVCHKAFPNSRKNVLRKPDFISGVFLEFYRNVYEKDYIDPPELPEWQLWHMLRQDKTTIFRILSHYFRHEEVVGLENAFQIILLREKKQLTHEPPKELKFLSQFSLEKVLDIYVKSLKVKDQYVDFKAMKTESVSLYEDEESKIDMLSHVQINPKTCHPYVICPITGKHWKECIGEYNVQKRSYVRLFKRFCEKYNKYPDNSDQLLCFLNMYIFQQKNEIPEIFGVNVRKELEKVFNIFKSVMTLYTCKEYIFMANEYFDEDYRERIEREMQKMQIKA